jgi:plasmid stabilization system protein ParE
MKILFKESFVEKLGKQLEYISLDSPKSAQYFKNELLRLIREIPLNPYKYRKSIYFDDQYIRDLIYKGYTIVYRINKDTIEVFGFVKYQQSPI